MIESKGKHLDSNPDTTYMRNVAELFDKVGHEVTWQQFGGDFKDHILSLPDSRRSRAARY